MSTVKPIKTRLALMSMTKIALFVGLSLKYWENRNILNDGEAFFKTFHFRLGHHDEKFVLPLLCLMAPCHVISLCSERCDDLTVLELQNRAKARGLKTTCFDNP